MNLPMTEAVSPVANPGRRRLVAGLAGAAVVGAPGPQGAHARPWPDGAGGQATAGDAGFAWHWHVPAQAGPGAPILVSVHGISRNAQEHLAMFRPLADAAGVVLLVPVFPQAGFPHYQRMQAGADGRRPDRLLLDAVRDVAARTGADRRRLHLFGYSGGAQFVHRFVMRHPGRVRSYALGAAGWYTLPDPALRYPHGLAYSRRWRNGGFDLAALLAVPGLVMAGERERADSSALRTTGRAVTAQGEDRRARARCWVSAMQGAAQILGLPSPVVYRELPRAGHSFRRSMSRGGMGEMVLGHVAASEARRGQLARPAGIEPAPQPSEGWMISTSPRSPELGF